MGLSARAQNYTQTDRFLKANSNWVFGDSAGINFNVNPPVGTLHHSTGLSGSAAVSHPETGTLLFYSNGAKCWKADGTLMLHGDSLLGNIIGHTTQGVCIVPFINDTNRYYLFSLSDVGTLDALFYSVIDMRLDNGQGDIDSTQKNILLHDNSLSEAMVAIPGECNDVWLLLHGYKDADFIAYHITSEGIDTTPVITTLGSPVVGGGQGTTYSRLAVSPDRRKIALNGRNLMDHVTFVAAFDPLTASVTNLIEIMGITPYRVPPFRFAAEPGYGLCFSTDNSKLYVSTSVSGNPLMTDPKHRLYQFDVSTFDSAAIVGSRYSVYETNAPEFSSGVDLRTYRDSIYICIRKSFPTQDRIDRINQPNISGAGCDYQTGVVSLAPGSHNQFTFGSDVVYPMSDTIAQHAPSADTAICTGGSVILTAPAGFGEYVWSDGSMDSTLLVSQADTYWVTYRDSCYNLYVDTYLVEELPFIPPVIQEERSVLSTDEAYETYQWLLNGNLIQGASDSIYTATENGEYQVVVTNEHGCSDTSAVYEVNNVNIAAVDDFGRFVRIYPNPAADIAYIQSATPVNVTLMSLEGRVLFKVKQAESVSVSDLAAGVYLLKIANAQGEGQAIERLVVEPK